MVRNHEALVHFPIALLLSAFIFSIIGLFYKRELFKEVIFWNLIIGLLALGAAIYTGMMEQEQVVDSVLNEELEVHKRNANILAVLTIYLLIWMGWRKKRMGSLEYFAWVALFFIASSSVMYQGHMGHDMSEKIDQLEAKSQKMQQIPKPVDFAWNF